MVLYLDCELTHRQSIWGSAEKLFWDGIYNIGAEPKRIRHQLQYKNYIPTQPVISDRKSTIIEDIRVVLPPSQCKYCEHPHLRPKIRFILVRKEISTMHNLSAKCPRATKSLKQYESTSSFQVRLEKFHAFTKFMLYRLAIDATHNNMEPALFAFINSKNLSTYPVRTKIANWTGRINYWTNCSSPESTQIVRMRWHLFINAS